MKSWLLLISLSIMPLTEVMAKSTEEKGLDIAQEMDRRDSGWADQRVNMEMILRNRQGQESIRHLRTYTLEVHDDGDKSLTVFNSPRDVKGTALLSYTHAERPDDQWLYLPVLKRIKRIAAANQSGPFMGSEFAYEDLTSQEIEKYNYNWLRDEMLDGRETFLVERFPAYKLSGYSRQVMWVDKTIYQPIKVEYYDRKGASLKTLTFYDYRKFLDRYWRPNSAEMVNHQTGKSTKLVLSNYEFKTGMTVRDFDRNTLKRTR